VTADERPKRSLADDPNFRASLSELDGDLAGVRRAGAAAPPPTTTTSGPAPRVVPHSGAQTAPPPAPGGRRRLLDLFPPFGAGSALPPDLAPLLAPPPARPPLPVPAAAGTVTYETFYGLAEEPFSQSTDPRFFYHSTAHDQVAQTLLGAIGQRERVVVLTGERGRGKTTLCHAVIDQLDRRTLTSFVTEPFVSAADLLKTILVDFGVISRQDIAQGRLTKASQADLVAALHEFLVSLAALQAFAVVILDDAHNLPVDVLNQVRVVADDLGGEPLLQVILVGEPALVKNLGRSELRALNRRASVRCRLKPLAADDVAGYIAHRIAVAGTSPRVEFDSRAVARVYQLSGGVPHLINLLCDRTLAAGFKASASLLDDQLVEAAAEELDLGLPSSRSSWASWAGRAAMIAGLLLLALLGAATAAYVFRSDLTILIDVWQGG